MKTVAVEKYFHSVFVISLEKAIYQQNPFLFESITTNIALDSYQHIELLI